MPNKRRLLGSFASFVLVNSSLVGLVACKGGRGGFSDLMAMWEPTSQSQERAGNTEERASDTTENTARTGDGAQSTAESAPGAQGGGPNGGPGGGSGAFDCTGVYFCQEIGDDDVDTIVLRKDNGVCIASTGDGDFTLESDGRIVDRKGKTIGSWSAAQSGFQVNGDDPSLCTKSNPNTGSSSGGGSSSSSSSGSGNTPSPNPTGTSTPGSPPQIPTFDAGAAPQPEPEE